MTRMTDQQAIDAVEALDDVARRRYAALSLAGWRFVREYNVYQVIPPGTVSGTSVGIRRTLLTAIDYAWIEAMYS